MNDRGDQSDDESDAAQPSFPSTGSTPFLTGFSPSPSRFLCSSWLSHPFQSLSLPAFLELWPDFLGYFISFSFIGGIWISHASLTHLMQRGDSISYGLNFLIATLTLSLLMVYVARQPQLVVDELADDTLKRISRQRWISIGVGAFAVILAFVTPQVAIALYLVEALLVVVLPLLGVHRARRNMAR